jgi:hypothetical protein
LSGRAPEAKPENWPSHLEVISSAQCSTEQQESNH